MSPWIALIIALLALYFWRAALVLIGIVLIALLVLGILSVSQYSLITVGVI